MVFKRKPSKEENEVAAPLVVVGGEEIHNNGDKSPDVLNRRSLGMEIGDGDGLVVGGRVVGVILGHGVVAGELTLKGNEGVSRLSRIKNWCLIP